MKNEQFAEEMKSVLLLVCFVFWGQILVGQSTYGLSSFTDNDTNVHFFENSNVGVFFEEEEELLVVGQRNVTNEDEIDVYLSLQWITESGEISRELYYQAEGGLIYISGAKQFGDSFYVLGEIRQDDSDGDFLLMKFDKEGGKIWERRYISSEYFHLTGMKVDDHGNLLITGFEAATKLNSEGEVLWSKRYRVKYSGSESEDEGMEFGIEDVAMLDSGLVYYTPYFNDHKPHFIWTDHQGVPLRVTTPDFGREFLMGNKITSEGNRVFTLQLNEDYQNGNFVQTNVVELNWEGGGRQVGKSFRMDYGMAFSSQLQKVSDTEFRVLGRVYYQFWSDAFAQIDFSKPGFSLVLGMDAPTVLKNSHLKSTKDANYVFGGCFVNGMEAGKLYKSSADGKIICETDESFEFEFDSWIRDSIVDSSYFVAIDYDITVEENVSAKKLFALTEKPSAIHEHECEVSSLGKEVKKAVLKVKQNPVRNGLLELVGINSVESVKVIDTYGNIVLNRSKVAAPFRLDVSGLAQGIYFIQCISSKQVVSGKIMIE